MLAQTYLSARKLGLTVKERDALIGVLEGLERGWFVHLQPHQVAADTSIGLAFNMGWFNCRTTACIAGWSDLMFGTRFVGIAGDAAANARKGSRKRRLQDLFFLGGVDDGTDLDWPIPDDITTRQAAHALRNYLTTGKPYWDLVLKEHEHGREMDSKSLGEDGAQGDQGRTASQPWSSAGGEDRRRETGSRSEAGERNREHKTGASCRVCA